MEDLTESMTGKESIKEVAANKQGRKVVDVKFEQRERFLVACCELPEWNDLFANRIQDFVARNFDCSNLNSL